MKKTFKLIGTILLAMALVFTMTACKDSGGDDTGSGTGGGNDTMITYTGAAGGTTYTLKVAAKASDIRAAYSPKDGDSYRLSNGSKTSAGTVSSFSGGTFTLKPSNSQTTFTAKVSGNSITAISGTITFNDGTTSESPGTITDPGGDTEGGDTEGGGTKDGANMASAITLSPNTWDDGDIASSGSREQWFKFTATAYTQYIHFQPGALKDVYVQLYNDKGTTVGARTNLYGSTTYTSRTVTSGSVYYIKVTPFSSSGSGAYQIGFNTATTPPPRTITLPSTNVTTLTFNTWDDGTIASSSGEQWFKFTATATTQYIHFQPGALKDVYVQLYDDTGTEVGARTNLYGSTTYTSRTVTSGSVYYIKVTPFSSSGSGAYQIGFNTATTPPKPPKITLPSANVTELTSNTWADGVIAFSSDEQWFKFTAFTGFNPVQHIYFWRWGGAPSIYAAYVQLYDDTGAAVGDRAVFDVRYNNEIDFISRTVTSGSVYYIKVTPVYYDKYGTFKIGVTEIMSQPGTTLTTLTYNKWADGNIASSSGEQWFKFTATALSQSLHFNPGSLNDVIVRLSGNASNDGFFIDDAIRMNTNNRYIYKNIKPGSVYYITVRPYSGSGKGTYQIGFNTATTLP